jgi:hypothetical protein
MRSLASVLGLLSVLAAGVDAQSVVVPNANASTRAGGGVNLVIVRTIMLGFPASELTGIPTGSYINGVSFRAAVSPLNPATWPPLDATWTNFDITVGYAIPLASWTGTFMSHFLSTPVPPLLVRSGPMVIEKDTYQNNSALPAPLTNPWGDFFFDFHKTFPYVGGDLAILLTHVGNNATGNFFVEAITSSPTRGVGFSSSSYQATSGASLPMNIARIHYGYGLGCPGTGGNVPNLVQTSDVTGGGAVTFGVSNAPSAATALYVIGATTASVPLPNGCTLLTNPVIAFPVVLSVYGRTAFAASFPPGLSLTAHVQAFVVDAGAQGGFSATNGVTLTVQP